METKSEAGSDSLDECDASDNHQWLIEQFVSVLVKHSPKSVLDVGCGAGMLLKACLARGLRAKGLDQAGPRLQELAEAGLDVSEGSAYELPFADKSEDWLVLRHVPHHLEDPSRAFRELLRVARRGVLIAEPFFEENVASQRGAVALDLWEKRQHRRRGMHHEPVYNLNALLEMMPRGFEADFAIEVHTTLRLRRRGIENLRAESEALIAELPAGDREHQALDELLKGLDQTGLSWNGSLLVALVRRA